MLHTLTLCPSPLLPVISFLQELLSFLTQDSTSSAGLKSHMWYCLFCQQQLPGAPLRGCDGCPLACHGACYTRTYGQPLAQGPDGRVLCLSCQDASLRTVKVGNWCCHSHSWFVCWPCAACRCQHAFHRVCNSSCHELLCGAVIDAHWPATVLVTLAHMASRWRRGLLAACCSCLARTPAYVLSRWVSSKAGTARLTVLLWLILIIIFCLLCCLLHCLQEPQVAAVPASKAGTARYTVLPMANEVFRRVSADRSQ
jgi:hypothetical protein